MQVNYQQREINLKIVYAGPDQAGTSAVFADNYTNLASLLNRAEIRERFQQGLPENVAYNLVPARVIDRAQAKQLPGIGGAKFPLNRHLFMMIQAKIKDVIPSERDFIKAFIRFEYLFGLAVALDPYGGITDGSYFWDEYLRYCRSRNKLYVTAETDREITSETKNGAEWAPYAADVFGDIGWTEFLEFKKEADTKIIKRLNEDFPMWKIDR